MKFDRKTFLPINISLTLPNECTAFLHENGLPSITVDGLFSFDLEKIEEYDFLREDNTLLSRACIIGTYDDTEHICIESSSGKVYLACKRKCEDEEKYILHEAGYINLDIAKFYQCLCVYENFNYYYGNSIFDLELQDQLDIINSFQKDLKTIDLSIAGTQIRAYDLDDFWCYLLEDWSHQMGLYADEE